MIRIQKLKEPKKTSGKKVDKDEVYLLKGIEIKNTNKFPVYVDFHFRKKPKTKRTL